MPYVFESEYSMEERCYFPEWADRHSAVGSAQEIDHNSYLAGGYAEEFGHRAQIPAMQAPPSWSEEDREWRVQIGCLHPGYPECPRPVDRGRPAEGRPRRDERPRAPEAEPPPRKTSTPFRVVPVGQRQAERFRRSRWPLWQELRIRRNRLPLG